MESIGFTCSGGECRFGHAPGTSVAIRKQHLLHHVKEGIPTEIPFGDINLLPSREDFLNVELRRLFKKQVDSGKPILFLPTTVMEKTNYVGNCRRHRIYMFGVLPCGSKTCVIIDDVEPDVDIRVPDRYTPEQFQSVLTGQISLNKCACNSIKDIKLFRFHGFQKSPDNYKRISFNDLSERKQFIDMVNSGSFGIEGVTLAGDDNASTMNTNYFAKVARTHRFNTADWNRIEKYVVLPQDTTTNCTYNFRVSVKDLKKLDSRKREACIKAGNQLSRVIDRDPTEVCMWDIETYRTVQNGMVPKAKDTDYTIFMICSVYFWHHSDIPLLSVCAVDKPTNARVGINVVINCGNEENVLVAHMEILSRMAPDILGAFNGSNFDWPLYREKMLRADKLVLLKDKLSSLPPRRGSRENAKDVLTWSFCKENVKIDATNKFEMECVAKFPGLLDIDVLPTFMRLYPRAEVGRAGSLNFFLAKNGLDSKEDMPYKHMFHIYERAKALMGAPRACHCSLQEGCESCKHVKDLDYKKANQGSMVNTEYTDELLATIKDGCVVKCCACSKRTQNAFDMADVGYYCVVDCVRPQELCVKRSIVPDKRELSTMSFVPLYDSFYRADGMKVRNLIGACSNKNNIAFSNGRVEKSAGEKDHYPGGWVYPPERGLHNVRPITGMDFASLYPSLMMTYNFSPDMVITDKATMEELVKEGYSLHHIEPFDYERGEKKGAECNQKLKGEGYTVRHNGVYNTRHYKQTIDRYVKYISHNINGTVIRYDESVGPSEEQRIAIQAAGTSRQVKYETVPGRDVLPGERMGIFPYVVKKLFDRRVPLKAKFVQLSKLKEQMELQKMQDLEQTLPDGKKVLLNYKADICFNLNKVESKQKALKVLSNTFYGESGNFRSTVYNLLVAAGITCAGQRNIKLVAKFVTSLGCSVKYGDTDSVYITGPDHVYSECDNKYNAKMEKLKECYPDEMCTGYIAAKVEFRKEYWTEMVAVTMQIMDTVKENIADYLLKDNGTHFLNMAYEEVGFPTVLCGKKKYFLTPHIEHINFYPKDIFIRGIEIVKQGQARIAKKLGEEFMREALSLENERELIDIAVDKIHKFYQTKLDPLLFYLTARYRPEKNNVPVRTFVDRMRECQRLHKSDPHMYALYEPPEAGDKFEYIMVDKPQLWDIKGKKIDAKKGYYMEFLNVYKATQGSGNPMRIKLDHYMKAGIMTLFARFIAYHPQFQPRDGEFSHLPESKQFRAVDNYCILQATEYLQCLVDKLSGIDKNVNALKGKKYKTIYRTAHKQLQANVRQKHGSLGLVLSDIGVCGQNTESHAKIVDQIKTTAENLAGGQDAGAAYMRANKMDVFKLHTAFNGVRNRGIARVRIAMCNSEEDRIIQVLGGLIPSIAGVLKSYESDFIKLIGDMRSANLHEDVIVDSTAMEKICSFIPADMGVLHEMHANIIKLAAVYSLRKSTLSIAKSIELARVKCIDSELNPNLDNRQVAKVEAKSVCSIDEYIWQ